jgi:hypothetical protein
LSGLLPAQIGPSARGQDTASGRGLQPVRFYQLATRLSADRQNR